MLEIARERRMKPDVQGNCEYNISVLYVQKQSFFMQQVFFFIPSYTKVNILQSTNDT